MENKKGNFLSLILKGALMGVAEVIPGVSGGTIAFITGIYERLLNSIKSFDFSLVQTFREGGIKALWKAIDGDFLSVLFLGMVSGVLVGTIFISYLLEQYPEPLWAFFFGLILSSSIYIGRLIPKWDLAKVGLLVVGFLVAFGITQTIPIGGSTSAPMLIFSGAIAISALMLPGISGSFILLLLGMYTIVIPALKGCLSDPSFDQFRILLLFGVGAIIGLVVFSRVLSWTFKRYRFPTFAILTGFMLGSLFKIWPWRNPTLLMEKEHSKLINNPSFQFFKDNPDLEFKVLSELNVMPSEYLFGEPHVLPVVGSFILGLLSVLVLSRFDKS